MLAVRDAGDVLMREGSAVREPNTLPYAATVVAPELNPLLAGADHVDVKITEANATLREFVSGALGWQPGWMRMLFGARVVFARLLHLRNPQSLTGPRLRPEEIPFSPGGKVWFFTLVGAAEDRYILLEAADTHLTGYVAVVAEHLGHGRNKLHNITVVKYHRWTGPLYFNVIRPFHHLVVRSMVNAGARGPRAERSAC
jgi:Protein of unknown function (DUF2867)